jgi:hypothetical protein
MDALGCAFLPASCALCGSPLPRLSYAPICAARSSEIPIDSHVVDDVITTGASARPTARALLKTGAETVWITTLARRTGATADKAFEAADDRSEIGAVPDFCARQASMYSQNQPSF